MGGFLRSARCAGRRQRREEPVVGGRDLPARIGAVALDLEEGGRQARLGVGCVERHVQPQLHAPPGGVRASAPGRPSPPRGGGGPAGGYAPSSGEACDRSRRPAGPSVPRPPPSSPSPAPPPMTRCPPSSRTTPRGRPSPESPLRADRPSDVEGPAPARARVPPTRVDQQRHDGEHTHDRRGRAHGHHGGVRATTLGPEGSALAEQRREPATDRGGPSETDRPQPGRARVGRRADEPEPVRGDRHHHAHGQDEEHQGERRPGGGTIRGPARCGAFSSWMAAGLHGTLPVPRDRGRARLPEIRSRDARTERATVSAERAAPPPRTMRP